MITSPTNTEADKLVAEIDREAERIAEAVLRRAPLFLERITADLYEVLLSEVQHYLRDNAAFNIKSGIASLTADRDSWRRVAERLEEEKRAAEARVTALEAERGGFQWFDIESAPKSGVSILVCGCSYGPAVRIAHWGNGRFLGRKKGYEQGWSHVPGHTCDPKFWAPIPMAQALSRSSTEVKNDGTV